MATRRRQSVEIEDIVRRPPATTPEGRENQLIAMAVDLVERQIREGTASSQILTHYLKLGSTREQLEQDRLRHENRLLEAKIEAMASAKRVEELYSTALSAMREYAGHEPVDDDYED
jgi:hypothetical protein